MPGQKFNFTNLVYGKTYAEIFLKHHVPSLLDQSNLPELLKEYEVTYTVFTDAETQKILEEDENFRKLRALIPVTGLLINWSPDVNKYEMRYRIQVETYKHSCKAAYDSGAWFSYLTADTLFGQYAYRTALEKMRAGHDGILTLPMRKAYEGLSPLLLRQMPQGRTALPARMLFDAAYAHTSPLWLSAHADAPRFTKMPYTILWNVDGRGMFCRTFSVSSIIVRPNEEMLRSPHVADVGIPSLCENPYWAYDWDECPLIGIEPMQNFFPLHGLKAADPVQVGLWARKNAGGTAARLQDYFYFPNRKSLQIPDFLRVRSDLFIKRVTDAAENRGGTYVEI